MAKLRDLRTGRLILIRASHRLGRDPGSDTVFTDQQVSTDHARIQWRDGRWVIRDLGSNNGTVVGGRPLSGLQSDLRRGARIELGGPNIALELVDDAPPVPFALCEDGAVSEGQGQELYLPSPEDCEVVILPDERCGWAMTRGDETCPVADRSTVTIRGLGWTLSLSRPVASTALPSARRHTMEETRLRFVVSLDEERVQLYAAVRDVWIDLGSYAHNYSLLTLARRRLEDRAAGLAEEDCGWWVRRQLADALRMDSTHLNVHLHRCRESLRGGGWQDADALLESLGRDRVRIGVQRLEIVCEEGLQRRS